MRSNAEISAASPRRSLLRRMLSATFLLLASLAVVTPLRNETSSSFTTVTTSGLSSGAFAAVQLHVAFSSRVSGAGAVAGGPFFCAQDNLPTALSSCMRNPELISVPELVQITRNTQLTGTIDAVSNLAGSRVYVFSGLNDTVVVQGVGKKLVQYYDSFGAIVTAELGVEAEHAMPLGDGAWGGAGKDCLVLGSPYMNRCAYDAAAELLGVLIGNETFGNEDDDDVAVVTPFDQRQFLPVLARSFPASVGMGDRGFIFVPSGCKKGGANCHIHVAFHGCLQSVDEVSMDFCNYAGYNVRSDVVILYPQARKAAVLGNPKGCWDWWGYTGTAYASQIGIQPASVWRMVEAAQRALSSGDWEREFGLPQ